MQRLVSTAHRALLKQPRGWTSGLATCLEGQRVAGEHGRRLARRSAVLHRLAQLAALRLQRAGSSSCAEACAMRLKYSLQVLRPRHVVVT